MLMPSTRSSCGRDAFQNDVKWRSVRDGVKRTSIPCGSCTCKITDNSEMSKRVLEAFLSPPKKRLKQGSLALYSSSPRPSTQELVATNEDKANPSRDLELVAQHESACEPPTKAFHKSWPHPISDLPPSLAQSLQDILGVAEGRAINNQPHLDLLYFQPLVPQPTATELFRFLRSELPFYRVCYKITRFGKPVDINTPRFTTVFGLDESSTFIADTSPHDGSGVATITTKIVEASFPTKQIGASKYKYSPRPIPPCLMLLKNITEALTNDTYNFVLVNYYATGSDSISFHSDDESFLGADPSIASFSLGARRDFLMKHKPPKPPPGVAPGDKAAEKVYSGTSQIKLPLGSGDMVLMRGKTQSHWLHSIPKRTAKGGEAERGRINITLRKAMVAAGTDNYNRYNVGDGPVYRWSKEAREMRPWIEEGS